MGLRAIVSANYVTEMMIKYSVRIRNYAEI